MTHNTAHIPYSSLSPIVTECRRSTIDALNVSPVIVEIGGPPVTFSLPAITDSGTTTLSGTVGFESETCGTFTVRQDTHAVMIT